MKNTHKFLIGAGVIVLVILGFIFIKSGNKPAEQSNKVVRVGYAPILGSLPVYIASENKYFEEQGVRYQLIELQSGNQLLEAIARGDIDVAPFGSLPPSLNAELVDPGKFKIISVSDLTHEKPFDTILVNSNSKVQSVKDLQNKKIGVFPGSTSTNFLKKYLADHGVDITKIEFIQLSPPNQLPALYGNSIDALFSFEPNTTIALENGKVRKIVSESVFASILNHSPQGVGLISSQFVKDNPELSKKVVNAIDKSYKFMTENDVKTREIAQKAFKLEPNVANKVVLTYMKGSNELDKQLISNYVDVLVSIGELKTRPDLSNLFYQP
jgi:NitT/TauT family transport system substrate-binding protein